MRRLAFVLSTLLVAWWMFGNSVARAQDQPPAHVITTSAAGARSAYAADLDRDGDADVLSASYGDDEIAWYENQGGSFSEQRVIATREDGAISVYAKDLNGDSYPDLLSASNGRLAWYENRDGDSFSEGVTINGNREDFSSVYSSDLDNDGDKDVISSEDSGEEIAWYENNGEANFDYTKIHKNDSGFESVHTDDIDGNGYNDIVAASSADQIVWFANESGTFSGKNVISSNVSNPKSVYTIDLDKDNDIDVISASYGDYKVAWYENTGGGNFSEQRVISTNDVGAISVYAKKLNNDERVDILCAAFSDDKVVWYKNKGGGSFSQQNMISENLTAASSVYAQDLDGDSDPDVLATGATDDKVVWYENTDGTLPVELADLRARVSERTVVLNWRTISETNNAGFQIQRHVDTKSGWTQVGYVQSKIRSGTTTETHSYQYTTNDLAVGTHQFRLKQVDLDGSTTLHGPISVRVKMQKAVKLVAPSPNPVSSNATLSFAVKKQSETTIALYNTLGQRVATLYQGTPPAGERQTAQVDASSLPSGTYFIRLQAGGKTATQRMTVVR